MLLILLAAMPFARVVDLGMVRQAMSRLQAVGAPPTPILRSEFIDGLVSASVHFKAEHLQRTGSFKYRGATNAVGALDAATVSAVHATMTRVANTLNTLQSICRRVEAAPAASGAAGGASAGAPPRKGAPRSRRPLPLSDNWHGQL